MTNIPAHLIFPFHETGMGEYKLHLATWNGHHHPLDVYLHNPDHWIMWNESRSGRDDFNRQYIFSLIQYYHESNKWLFGGIFEVIDRFEDWQETNRGYQVRKVEQYENLVGRLIIDFTLGVRGRSFLLENHFDQFTISQILKQPYDGAVFPGYENIHLSFGELASLIKHEKRDWKAALENVKGVYVIFDTSNGKKYVGSAYGDQGIWSRWSSYVKSEHGNNQGLIELLGSNDENYARENFRFSLLEYRPMKTDDKEVRERESFWKEVLLSRGEFGYNGN
jgi:hypothetical protein